MSILPIDKDILQSIIGSDLLLQNFDEDPSSDINQVLDWLTECLKSIIPYKNEQQPELSLRVKKCLKNVSGSNGNKEQLLEKLLETVRSELIAQKNSILNSSNDTTLKLLFRWISLAKQRLKYIHGLLKLQPDQIELLDRASNSIFQSIVLEKRVWNLIQIFYQNGIFSKTIVVDMETVYEASILLSKIDLSDELSDLLMKMTKSVISEYIASNSARNWDKSIFPDLLQLEKKLYLSLCNIIPNEKFTPKYLKLLIKDELVRLRIEESFDIVIDFPHSKVALEDLREALTNEYQKSKLVNTFIKHCEERLIHAGVSTVDILATYISTIRCFLIIDHRGVLLDKVCRPIRRYLKQRDDTIRQIVFGLLDTSSQNYLPQLAHEIRLSANKRQENQDLYRTLDWVPDPVDALPDFKRGVVEDIVESLISIFDSKDVFMDEFVNIFSVELLKLKDYNVTSIKSKLQLLKSRFIGSDFTALEVMIKDIIQSSKLDKKIQSNSHDPRIHSSIISHLYWPELSESKFNLPKYVESGLKQYESLYEQEKKGRKLVLHPSLGSVSVTVEFKDRVLTLDVPPDKAAVLFLLQELPENMEIKLGLVCMRLQMPLKLAMECLTFWVKNNVLIQTGLNSYKIKEESK